MPGSPRTVAIGTAVHNGWVILVSVDVHDGQPRVVDRRRAELVAPGVSDNPYHHEGLSLPIGEAMQVVRRSWASVRERSRTALAELVERISGSATVTAMALTEPREVPTGLADVLANRKLVYVADRHMYEVALAEAAGALRIRIVSYPRKGEIEFAASALRVTPDTIAGYVRSLRETVGAPWRQDHQVAAAAAIGALAQTTRLTIPRPRS